MSATEGDRAVRAPSLVDAVVPVMALVVLIGGSLALFGPGALDGPLQVISGAYLGDKLSPLSETTVLT